MTTEKAIVNNDINLNDFAIVVNIIDACTERGAFKGNELMSVGMIREKFANFVKLNAPTDTSVDAEADISDE